MRQTFKAVAFIDGLRESVGSVDLNNVAATRFAVQWDNVGQYTLYDVRDNMFGKGAIHDPTSARNSAERVAALLVQVYQQGRDDKANEIREALGAEPMKLARGLK